MVGLVALACSSGGDGEPSSGGGSGGATGGGGGLADAGCDVGLPDGACPGVSGGGGTGGGSGGGSGTTCSGAGLVECPSKPAEYWDVCDRVAYECTKGAGLGYTSATSCDALNSTGTPMCCVPWDKACEKIDSVDCAALGGAADCFKCRDENGAAHDPNNCKKAAAACTTNNECCNRCCRSDGKCT